MAGISNIYRHRAICVGTIFDMHSSLSSMVNNCNSLRQRPESHVIHSMLATPSSAPTRSGSELILHLATVVGIEIWAGITG